MSEYHYKLQKHLNQKYPAVQNKSGTKGINSLILTVNKCIERERERERERRTGEERRGNLFGTRTRAARTGTKRTGTKKVTNYSGYKNRVRKFFTGKHYRNRQPIS